MTERCPKCGEASTDPEYCSECGAAMVSPSAAPPAPASAPSAPSGAPELCPVCGEARPSPQARFCDTCRYDFVAAQPFGAQPFTTEPVAAQPVTVQPPALPPVPVPVDAPAQVVNRQRWELLGQVDETLRKPEDPSPTDRNERLFPLSVDDHLIGRRSDSADIHPKIVIPDPGISRRHARILRQADGGMALVDLGSMNGTRLNGAVLEPNVIHALSEGDQITLGCWTRLVLRAR